jgi:hypothetical protein
MAAAKEPDELPGIPVDGEFYNPDDLTGREQRMLRDAMRELTGNDSATLNAFLEFGLIDDFDFVCGMTFVIRKRSNDKYTLDEALELKPAEVTEAGHALLKEKKRRRPPKAASSTES